jgi:actin-related protein
MKTLKNKMKKTCTKNEWHDILKSLKTEMEDQANITQDIIEPIYQKLNEPEDFAESFDSWDNM